MTPRELALRAARILDERKGEAVLLLDVSGLSSICDYVLIATGTSPPHVKALFSEVHQGLKREGMYCYRRTGTPESGWMVLDYVDVVIHVFAEALRHYYAIEDLWPEAPRLESH